MTGHQQPAKALQRDQDGPPKRRRPPRRQSLQRPLGRRQSKSVSGEGVVRPRSLQVPAAPARMGALAPARNRGYEPGPPQRRSVAGAGLVHLSAGLRPHRRLAGPVTVSPLRILRAETGKTTRSDGFSTEDAAPCGCCRSGRSLLWLRPSWPPARRVRAPRRRAPRPWPPTACRTPPCSPRRRRLPARGCSTSACPAADPGLRRHLDPWDRPLGWLEPRPAQDPRPRRCSGRAGRRCRGAQQPAALRGLLIRAMRPFGAAGPTLRRHNS